MALTDEQLKALGLYTAPPEVAPQPASPPPAAILSAGNPPHYPQSILGNRIAPGAMIPTGREANQLPLTHEESKELYQGLMPKIAPAPTAAPGTLQWQQQRTNEIASRSAQMDFKKANPWGSAISEHPGVAGKILHGLSIAGNIAGNIVEPGIMSLIPGTQLHDAIVRSELGQQENEAQREANRELTSEQTTETQAAKEQAKEEKDTNELEQKYRKLGLKLDEQGNVVGIPYEEMSPTEQAANDLKTNQAEAAKARAELDKMKGNESSPIYQMQLERLHLAEQNSSNAQQRLGLSSEQFQNKLQEQELLKPSGQAQSRGSAAQSALEVMPELEQKIRSNAAELGPIFGRIQKGEIKLGDVSPDIQKLYSAMQSFYALQPAVHGFRNAEFVKDFPSFVGGLQTNPEATLAGLEGLRPTLEAVAKEGRTYHKRVVEGRASPISGAGSTSTGRPSFAEWKKQQESK